jgi:hypothetical protein
VHEGKPWTKVWVHLKFDRDVTFSTMEKLSKRFGTQDINLRGSRGWRGTEVTPGDEDSLYIVINLRTPKPA